MSASDNENDKDIVVPVVREEVTADTVPVETGGVRITKHPHTRDEAVEQELRRGRVDVKRVKMNVPVNEPPPVRREGDTTIISVVAEVLKIEKQLVVTEEIHITRFEEQETVRQKVKLNSEEVQVERFDPAARPARRRTGPRSLIKGAPHRT